MDLVQMGLQGSLMIAAVLVARALLLHKLPKTAFYVLWTLVAVRLLVPFSIPVPANVLTLAQSVIEAVVPPEVATPADVAASSSVTVSAPDALESATSSASATAGRAALPSAAVPAPDASAVPATTAAEASAVPQQPSPGPLALVAQVPWATVWGVGSALCACGFLFLYRRAHRRFCTAAPARTPQADAWLGYHRLRRSLDLRECPGIASPMTYGVLRPVILLPMDFDWSDRARAALVLEHEYVHVRRFDAVFKLVLAGAVCLYWFNPLVWIMFAFANRDIELACDELVVRRLNTQGKKTYATALIDATVEPAIGSPVLSAFGASALSERIQAIATARRMGATGTAAAALLIVGVSAAFATTAAPQPAPRASDTVQSGVLEPATPAVDLEAAEDEDATAGSATAPGEKTAVYIETNAENAQQPTFEYAGNPQEDPELVYAVEQPSANPGEQVQIVTPDYEVSVSGELFPNGYTWNFFLDGSDLAPSWATEVLAIYDGDTGEPVVIAYIFPLEEFASNGAPCGPGSIPEYVISTTPCYGDYEYAIALAIEESRVAPDYLDYAGFKDGWIPLVEENLYGCALSWGLSNYVEGLPSGAGPTPGNVASDAFIAHASQSDAGTVVSTPAYSVTIPQEHASDSLWALYRHVLGPTSAGAYGAPVLEVRSLTLSWDKDQDMQSFSVYCREEGATSLRGADELEYFTGLYTEDGLEIAVSCSSLYLNDDGTPGYHTDWERAWQDAQLFASWISVP